MLMTDFTNITDLDCSKEALLHYQKGIELIQKDEYKLAIVNFLEFIKLCFDLDDKALAYIICGFLYLELNQEVDALNAFSKAIELEDKLKVVKERSKSFCFKARSDSKYKIGDFKGALDDLKIAHQIKKSENLKSNKLCYKLDHFQINFVDKNKLECSKFKSLVILASKSKLKYDLIKDYKKVISNQKKNEVITLLEKKSQLKDKEMDYRRAVIALRRVWKYY